MTRRHPPQSDGGAPSHRAMLVWGIGLLAYVIAVLNRSSFGAAAPDAVARFEVSAATLSMFAALQVGVYAAGQLPFGIALDRFGARRVLLSGLLLMTIGQTLLAVSGGIGLALTARALVGFGDAGVFISVLRVLPEWFAPRRIPMFTQLTSIVGQLGQVLSAVPLMFLLHAAGWAPAFMCAAGSTVFALIVVFLGFANAPQSHGPVGAGRAAHAPLKSVLQTVWLCFRTPATRMGMWTHATTLSTFVVFALLWGVPLTISLGFDRAQAAAALTLLTLVGIVAGPIVGSLTASYLRHRIWIALGLASLTAAGWMLLVLPVHLPYWAFLCAVALIGVGSPASSIGFDFVRTGNPPERQGLASGFVNIGGFGLALFLMLAVGIALDWLAKTTGRPVYDAESFRLAMVLMPLGMLIGAGEMLRTHRQMRQTE